MKKINKKTLTQLQPVFILLILLAILYFILIIQEPFLQNYLPLNYADFFIPLASFLIFQTVVKIIPLGIKKQKTQQSLQYLFIGISYAVFIPAFIIYDPFTFQKVNKPFFFVLQNSIIYIILLIAAITIYYIGSLQKQKIIRIPSVLLSVILSGFSIWGILTRFAEIWSFFNQLALISIAGFSLVSLSIASYFGTDSKSIPISTFCNWFVASQLRNYTIGVFIAVYLIYIRSFLLNSFAQAPLIEWLIIILILIRIYSGIKNHVDTTFVNQKTDLAQLQSWETKHKQEITLKKYNELENIVYYQRLFIETGEKTPLLVFLITVLNENDFDQKTIADLIYPLVSHTDRLLPYFAFSWEKKRVLKYNKKKRQEVLDNVLFRFDKKLNQIPEKILQVMT
ncbi:MAG: hypothetical protein KGY50_04910 [Candidatus Thermoplasmatota archaeon]|nr:hypothetical protein [Candidatus Thermoplasmatota archaeon]